MAGDETISLTGALALSIGIALQNFPERAIIPPAQSLQLFLKRGGHIFRYFPRGPSGFFRRKS